MRRLGLIAILCVVSIGLTANAAEEHSSQLAGYSAQGSQTEREWEGKFKAIPQPDNMRTYMEHLSAYPHHVGSPYDKANAEWILSKFKEFGLDAHIETYYVLFPTPKQREVEMVAPNKFVAKMQEPTVPEDATSGQHAQQLPTAVIIPTGLQQRLVFLDAVLFDLDEFRGQLEQGILFLRRDFAQLGQPFARAPPGQVAIERRRDGVHHRVMFFLVRHDHLQQEPYQRVRVPVGDVAVSFEKAPLVALMRGEALHHLLEGKLLPFMRLKGMHRKKNTGQRLHGDRPPSEVRDRTPLTGRRSCIRIQFVCFQ